MRSLVILLLTITAAQAQPADCRARPLVPGQTMALDLAIPLKGRPGVPQAARGGYVGLGLQDVPANGTICGAAPLPPPLKDVLRGPSGGDVLRGAPSQDLLMGTPPQGEVIVDPN